MEHLQLFLSLGCRHPFGLSYTICGKLGDAKGLASLRLLERRADEEVGGAQNEVGRGVDGICAEEGLPGECPLDSGYWG